MTTTGRPATAGGADPIGRPGTTRETAHRQHPAGRWWLIAALAVFGAASGYLLHRVGRAGAAPALLVAALALLPSALVLALGDRWLRPADYGRWLLLALAALCAGAVGVLALDPELGIGTLAALLVLLLSAAQARLRAGLIATAIVWSLLAAALTAAGLPATEQIGLHLAVLQSVLVGVLLNRALADLSHAELVAQRSLHAHRERFERTRQSRARFIAAASHDLRQPLHAMAFLSQALRARLADDPAEAVLRRLEQAALTTDQMIRDLLELTKLEVGAVDLAPQPVALHTLFENIQSEFLQAARAKGLALHIYKTNLTCRSDPVALQRVVSNLVSNAIRYTDVGLVYVRAEAADRQIRIRVRDTGIGIAPEDLEQVFEEFHQVRKDRGGTGLGLAIAKRLCDALGHRLEVESAPGKGSAFTVVLRQQAPEDAPVAPAAPGTQLLGGVHPASPPMAGSVVVLIDDDRERRQLVRPVIESWGCTVVDAGSGTEAEEKLSGMVTTPDLMIVDSGLAAGETADRAIARLRNAYGAAIPSVVMGAGAAEATGAASRAERLDPASLQRALLQARQTLPPRRDGAEPD